MGAHSMHFLRHFLLTALPGLSRTWKMWLFPHFAFHRKCMFMNFQSTYRFRIFILNASKLSVQCGMYSITIVTAKYLGKRTLFKHFSLLESLQFLAIIDIGWKNYIILDFQSYCRVPSSLKRKAAA